MKFRGFHYSIGQGLFDNWQSLWRLVPFVADCGYNSLVLYMGGAWNLKSHPQLADSRGSYSPEEMGKLAGYAKDCGIDFIPSIVTISHFGYILKYQKYHRLAVGEGSDMDAMNPEVYQLFEDIFDEILPCFDSSYVFINGDEMNLVHLNERARREARRNGLGALHGKALGRLAKSIIRRGRRPIVWHDMFLHHPEGLAYMPKETIIAYWHYDHQPEYPAIRYFCDQGYDVIASSGQMPALYPVLPDYRRGLPNIKGQALAASQAAIKPKRERKAGKCLGSMLTLWENNSWWDSSLALYAGGRWMNNPGIPCEQVLRDFAGDVFGVQEQRLGALSIDITDQINPLVVMESIDLKGRSSGEKQFLQKEINARRHKMMLGCERLKTVKAPVRNKDIFTRMVSMGGMLADRPSPEPLPKPKQELFAPALVETGDHACRLIRGQTPYGHELMVLTNGLMAVTILPEFNANMIEWVVFDQKPWSGIASNYRSWALREKRVALDKNPGMGSPWASGISGWRELIFFNSRLNPCTLSGHPFKVEIVRQTSELITLACSGHNEVADVRRLVTLREGLKTIEIETMAVNRWKNCSLAIQPHACHAFPDANPSSVRVIEKDGGKQKACSVWAHNGTLPFMPDGNTLRLQSPFSNHFIECQYRRSEIWAMLIWMGVNEFTLEPYGAIRECGKGDKVGLHLKYNLG